MKLNELFDRWLHWLTDAQHNLRSFAVLRILFGVGLLATVVPSIADRSMIWGAASFWVDPEAKRRGYFTFDLLLPKDNAVLFDIVFFGMIALILLFTRSWQRSRFALGVAIVCGALLLVLTVVEVAFQS